MKLVTDLKSKSRHQNIEKKKTYRHEVWISDLDSDFRLTMNKNQCDDKVFSCISINLKVPFKFCEG